MTCVITLPKVMNTQKIPQFSLNLIAYFEWNNSMGIALKDAREKQDISQRNLVKKIEQQTGVKISYNHLSDLENGKSNKIEKNELVAITTVLGIEINDLETT